MLLTAQEKLKFEFSFGIIAFSLGHTSEGVGLVDL